MSLTDGPTHKYLGASAGCWKVFGEVLAKEYSDPAYATVHRLTVDAYAVQHPGQPEPRSIQSINVHLISLYLIFEKQYDFKFATQAMGKIIEKKKSDFLWLEPPNTSYPLTVVDIVRAQTSAEHISLVRKWALSTWNAWATHHETISLLAKNFLCYKSNTLWNGQ